MANSNFAAAFKVVSRRDEHGFAPAYEIHCTKCSHIEQMVIRNGHGAKKLPVDVIAKKFRDKGWSVGSRRNKDICPECQKTTPSEARKEPETMSKPNPPLTVVAAEPPREATRDQKRAILHKLDENYDEKARSYVGACTDQTIASELGVPRAWVSDLREEFYGPSGENDEVRALRKEMQTERERIKKLEAAAMGLVDNLAEAAKRLEAIDRKADAISKALG